MRVLIPDNFMRNVRATSDNFKNNNNVELSIAMPKSDSNSKFKKRIFKKIFLENFDKTYYISSPFDSIENFINDLLDILKKENYDVVMPFGHATVAACSYYKDEIEKHSKLIFPSYDTFMNFQDKWKTYKICKKNHIPVPKTYHPIDLNDLSTYKNKIDYPLVIKAQIGCGIKNGVEIAEDWNEVKRKYKNMVSQKSFSFLDNFERPILQEYMEGEIHDVVGVFDKGKPVGLLSQYRYITYPIDGGTGSVNITTNDVKAKNYMKKLMDYTKWTGPAMGEFMYIPEIDDYKLIEVNPKFWGTLALSLSVGMDFPLMSAKLALGEEVETVTEYQLNHMYRWSLSDEIKSLSQYSSKFKALKEYISRSFRKNKSGEFSFNYFTRSMIYLLYNFKYVFKKNSHYYLFDSKRKK